MNYKKTISNTQTERKMFVKFIYSIYHVFDNVKYPKKKNRHIAVPVIFKCALAPRARDTRAFP